MPKFSKNRKLEYERNQLLYQIEKLRRELSELEQKNSSELEQDSILLPMFIPDEDKSKGLTLERKQSLPKYDLDYSSFGSCDCDGGGVW